MKASKRGDGNVVGGGFLTSVMALVLGVVLVQGMPLAQAQTFTLLHQFTGNADGGGPYSSLVMDRGGNLYGNAAYGGNLACRNFQGDGCGVVFKLTRHQSTWLFASLYTFAGGNDGSNPFGPVTIAADGTVYGTTNAGGGGGSCSSELGSGCGTVFRLRPPANRCSSVLCPWGETVLYRFSGGSDGWDPWAGVVVDGANNVYGTTYHGGASTYGTVFELTPSGSGWTKSEIHNFVGGSDGAYPASGLAWDGSGNLYGTTELGGGTGQCGQGGCGTVFQLTPSGSGWNENLLYSFRCGNDGCIPRATPILDSAGNVYGTSSDGFNTVYELSNSNGSWTFSSLYGFDFGGLESFTGTLARDAAGNLYGTTLFGGSSNCTYGCGTVFKLTPGDGGWTYSLLYSFTGRGDGQGPLGGVIVGSDGNLYGTAAEGGLGNNNCEIGCGTVWEITP